MRKKKAYLELLLKDEIVEGVAEHSLISRKARTSLHDILEALHRAAKDPKISALLLKLERLDSGWARLDDLRRALMLFRRSGKPIFCYLQEGGNAEYYLASTCDQIFMPPASHLLLVGLAAEVFFVRDLMDRLGVEARMQSIGEYKSAAETFTRTNMSPEARQQLDSLLEDYYEELCGAIQGRGFTPEEVGSLIDSGPFTSREALAHKLIDNICYLDEVSDRLKKQLGERARPVPAGKYSAGDGFLKRLFTFRRARIAVINVSGPIIMGENRRNQSGRSVSGADTIGKFLEHAGQSKRAKAIVLRVNSPGGSGLASDLIWRQIVLAGKKKPVVMSFGDVAASGGYYIASAGSRILAEKTSLTGSIGVLAGKFVAKELMKNLSVQREMLQRGKHAGYVSFFSEFTEEEEEQLRTQMREFYRDDFLKKVAAARNMDEDAVDQVARGRIWSGKKAKEHNLVDEIGGLTDAIEQARKLAGIEEKKKTRLVYYYKRRKLWERLMPDFRSSVMAKLFPAAAHDAIDFLDDVGFIDEIGRQKILLLMPFQIRIH